MKNDNAFELKDVWVFFNGIPVLESINLTASSGDFLGVIGPNGGGKTTLLKVILGLVKPSRGTVHVFGQPAGKAHRNIGYVPQYASIDREFPISVLEVILTARYSDGFFDRHKPSDIEAASDALGTMGIAALASRQIGELSGGQLQRVLIARALATRPKLLLLDEPTASIDPDTQTGFYELMTGLKKNMTIVMVSHDIAAISVYVDKIACLNRRLVYHGSGEVDQEMLESTYGCPVRLITHDHAENKTSKRRGR